MTGNAKATDRPRVAILGSRGIPASYGGFETIAQELGSGLVREGFEVYVSCESDKFKIRPYGSFRGIRLVYFPITNRLRSISEAFLYDLLSVLWATIRVDAIYMLGYSSCPTLILPKLFGKPVLVNVDGLEAARPKFNAFLRFFYRSFEKMVTKIASHIVVDSRTIGLYYSHNYNVKPIYIPNGGGCTRDIKPLNSDTLKSHGLERGNYYLYIARLTPDNSIDFIISAFEKSSSKKKLAIVGPLVENNFVKRLLETKDERIVFLGGIYEARLQRTLRYNCFAYLHGHQMGGTSVSLVEAMSCRNTILAIDTESNREVAETSATYYKKEIADFKEKIETLERNSPTVQTNDAAFQLYQKKYSTDSTVKKFADILLSLA